MFKKYHIHAGTHVATIIAILTSIPRLIRFESLYFAETLYQIGFSFFTTMILWIICEYFLNLKACKKPYKLILTLIFGMIASVILIELSNYLFKDIALENAKFGAAFHLSRQQQFYLFFFKGFTFTGLIYFIAHNIRLVEEKQITQIELEQLKQDNLEARLSLLKQQVSPHFLFNSLSTLKTIAPDSKTKNFVVQLSNVYRYLLNDKGFNNHNLVSLQEELAFTQSYLYILSERFEDALLVSIDIDEVAKSKKLPPLALQILIENAIKHNILSLEEPLKINIYTEDSTLIVSNKLQLKRSTEDSLGLGLQNIKDRYILLDDKEIEIIKTTEDFTVKLPLLGSKEEYEKEESIKPSKFFCPRKSNI